MDGTLYAPTIAGIAGPALALALALDEQEIQSLARQAAAIAIAGKRVIRRSFVRIGAAHVEQVRERVERAAAQIVRDFLYSTPRGLRRAANQRRAGADPAGVLIPERLAAVVANALRDARRPPRRKAAAVAPAGAKTADDCGLKPLPARDRGDPGLCAARRRDAAAEIEIEVEGVGFGAEPMLWMIAIEAQAEAEWRAAALPVPRPRPRPPRPILHLHRATAGGAS